MALTHLVYITWNPLNKPTFSGPLNYLYQSDSRFYANKKHRWSLKAVDWPAISSTFRGKILGHCRYNSFDFHQSLNGLRSRFQLTTFKSFWLIREIRKKKDICQCCAIKSEIFILFLFIFERKGMTTDYAWLECNAYTDDSERSYNK